MHQSKQNLETENAWQTNTASETVQHEGAEPKTEQKGGINPL